MSMGVSFDGTNALFTFNTPRGSDGSSGSDGEQGPPGEISQAKLNRAIGGDVILRAETSWKIAEVK